MSATLIAYPNFDEKRDAQALKDAMKGIGCNDTVLIDVLCRRTNAQRQKIVAVYKTMFGKDLMADIKSETSGNFEKVLVALLTPLDHYFAKILHDAIKGLGTDEEALIEVLCTSPNHAINTIRTLYEKDYRRRLEDDIKGDTSGHFKRLLVSLCNAGRDESGVTDRSKAREDAADLYAAGEMKLGTDESTFNRILCQRNYQQLRMVFTEYELMSTKTLEEAIKSEFSGDVKEGLLAIVQCVRNKIEYFAQRLHKSMAGLGTTDKQLIRIVVTRSEIDMLEIKAKFLSLYGKSLTSWIKGDTSGSYKKALLALIGE